MSYFSKNTKPLCSDGDDEGPRIRVVSYPDGTYLGLWVSSSPNFICMEPWHGVAEPRGIFPEG